MDDHVTQLYLPDTLIMPSFSWEKGEDNKTNWNKIFYIHEAWNTEALYFTGSSRIATSLEIEEEFTQMFHTT